MNALTPLEAETSIALGAPVDVTIDAVAKDFGDSPALFGVSLDVRAGELVALLGPSGSGKTTLLRILAGLEAPSAGRVLFGGEDALGLPVQDRNIGFVFQEPTLLPWASVFDNVWLPLRLKGVSRAKAEPAVMEMLSRVHLTGFENAVPRELSGGMKMRVSIARAMVTKPRILLMDEPFAALDEITRFKLNNDLLELWQDERFTVLFVTHSVFESVFLSSRVVVMAARPGRVFSELAVDAPYPRDEAFRTSPGYAALCRQASDVLVNAINSTAGPNHDGH